MFNLNASTGEITVKPGASIDYESSDKSYSVTVSVTDGEDASGDAESDPTIDATVSVRIEVNNVDDPGIVTLSVPTPTVDSALRASFSDQDGGSMLYRVQWSKADAATGPFVDIDGANRFSASDTDSYYTPTAADQGKYLKATMSYFERRCGVLHSIDDPCRIMPGETSDNRVAAAQSRNSVQNKVPNSQATGGPSITGTPLVGETLTANTTGISDSDGMTSAVFAHQWVRHDLASATDTDIEGATDPTYTLVDADAGKALKVRVNFTDDVGNAETLTSNAVAASPPVVVPDPLTATTHDAPGSHDGSAAFSFELWFSEAPAVGFATVRDHAFTVTEGSVDNVRRLVPGNNARWEITVTPSSEAAVTLALNATTNCSAEGAICNVDGVKLSGGLELVVPWTSSPLSPATGAPTINGTARVGESLTASTSGIADADGLANASFTYQWLAADVDISGATGSSYTVVTADAGKVIKVTVSFTDDAGNEESVTSAATAAVTQPPLTASTHDVPESHDGATAFTFELWFSEEPGGGFSATTLRDQALTVSGGTITNVRQLETGKNLKWEITLQPSGNEEVTVILPPTIDCADQGAICAGDGRVLSVGQAILVLGPQNSAATGAPTINGTAQTGQTLTATTSGIADEDGLTGAAFTYQWVRSDSVADTDIDAATGSTYVVATADEGKVIKVRVSFTDDLGNSESLTSNGVTAAAVPDDPEDTTERRTDPVVDPDPDPVLAQLTATLSLAPESHNGSDTFAFHMRFSEEPKSTFSYLTMHHHAFTVTGGSVTKARRLDPPSNAGWEILVQPDANGPVTIVLPATSDCDDDGAVCTEDGRKLSNRLQLTVSGP